LHIVKYIADLHIHSKYSRATSKNMDIENLVRWAKIKGISMLGTGDFTHPLWFDELKRALTPKEEGTYERDGIDFILSAEVSNIYSKAGKTRKVHNILFSPDIKTAGEINSYLKSYGKLASDGRPMLGLACAKMAKAIREINPDCMIIPAHAWTPHFSVFGSNSGFNNIEDCFEDETPNIFSFETGLSSDPAMNWRWSALDRFTLISNSDAHSPPKLGREANVFDGPVTYMELRRTLKEKDTKRFLYTIEFFPEEGKYHWDGHRPCKQRLSPRDAEKAGYICPNCGKKVTIGVLNRVESLCDRPEGYAKQDSPPYKSLVPLIEVIASALDVGAATKTAEREYNRLIKTFGTEFGILLDISEEDIKSHVPPRIAAGILNVRRGEIEVLPGYDGEYGEIRVFGEKDEEAKKQLTLF